jgi:hypothetical protein
VNWVWLTEARAWQQKTLRAAGDLDHAIAAVGGRKYRKAARQKVFKAPEKAVGSGAVSMQVT